MQMITHYHTNDSIQLKTLRQVVELSQTSLKHQTNELK